MPELKPASEVVALILDYGYFIEAARTLSKTFKKVYYWSPEDTEFKDVHRCSIGDGVEEIERLDDWERPENLDKIDLFCFLDLGFAPKQAWLRSIGKAVWGSGEATNIELSRTGFLKWVKEMGLPYAPYVVQHGIQELWEHLKTVERKWVKVNKFREQQETFFHQNITYSRPILEALALKFGGLSEEPVFVVQDEIESDAPDHPVVEIGYDGWVVNGEFPMQSFAGLEKKNELYLGALRQYDQLPEPVRRINEAISPYLIKWNDNNFISTEIRLREESGVMVPYYIDPTMRCAGLTMEHNLENCTNFAECIWEGANGNLIKPEFKYKFAAEATMHCSIETEGWRVVKNPHHPMVKFDHFCEIDGYCHFPPRKSAEVGVVLGLGDSIQEAIENLKDNFKAMEDEPVSINVAEFSTLLKSVETMEAQGIPFSDETVMPDDSVLVED